MRYRIARTHATHLVCAPQGDQRPTYAATAMCHAHLPSGERKSCEPQYGNISTDGRAYRSAIQRCRPRLSQRTPSARRARSQGPGSRVVPGRAREEAGCAHEGMRGHRRRPCGESGSAPACCAVRRARAPAGWSRIRRATDAAARRAPGRPGPLLGGAQRGSRTLCDLPVRAQRRR